jgi:hypothetical protein
MMINTHDPTEPGRDGPLSRNSRLVSAGRTDGASPLIECPCTTRTERRFNGIVLNEGADACTAPLGSSQGCFDAALELQLPASEFLTIQDPLEPAGCFMATTEEATTIYFNEDATLQQCGVATEMDVATGTASSLVTLGLEIDGSKQAVAITISGPADRWFGVGFSATAMADR